MTRLIGLLLAALGLLLVTSSVASAQFDGPVSRGVADVYSDADVALGNIATTYSDTFGDGGDVDLTFSADAVIAILVSVPNTTGNIDANVEASYDGGTTWAQLAAPTATQDLDTEAGLYVLDTAALPAPLYRVALVAAADDDDKVAAVHLAVFGD